LNPPGRVRRCCHSATSGGDISRRNRRARPVPLVANNPSAASGPAGLYPPRDFAGRGTARSVVEGVLRNQQDPSTMLRMVPLLGKCRGGTAERPASHPPRNFAGEGASMRGMLRGSMPTAQRLRSSRRPQDGGGAPWSAVEELPPFTTNPLTHMPPPAIGRLARGAPSVPGAGKSLNIAVAWQSQGSREAARFFAFFAPRQSNLEEVKASCRRSTS
jgi:hypothetical protein